MLKISNLQYTKLQEHIVSNFEDEMFRHVKTYFPNHFAIMNEEDIYHTIKYTFKKCKSYKFTTKRNLCLYLNMAFMLGSNFDNDPQYPWAKAILKGIKLKNSVRHIDDLKIKSQEIFNSMAGKNNAAINRFFLNFSKHHQEIYNTIITLNLKKDFTYLQEIYPEKYSTIGEQNISKMLETGSRNAEKYGLTNNSSLAIFGLLQFIGGSGFDTDPQFQPISELLNNQELETQNEKSKLIYDKTLEIIQKFITSSNLTNLL